LSFEQAPQISPCLPDSFRATAVFPEFRLEMAAGRTCTTPAFPRKDQGCHVPTKESAQRLRTPYVGELRTSDHGTPFFASLWQTLGSTIQWMEKHSNGALVHKPLSAELTTERALRYRDLGSSLTLSYTYWVVRECRSFVTVT